MSLQFHNQLTKKVDTFTPITEGEVSLYTCGPTVYSNPTVGNCRITSYNVCYTKLLRTRAPASLIRIRFFSPDRCRYPYELSQDCTSRGRPKREIMIDEIEMRIAGSSDGSIFLLEPSQWRQERVPLGDSYVSIRSTMIYRITSYNVCYTKLLRLGKIGSFELREKRNNFV